MLCLVNTGFETLLNRKKDTTRGSQKFCNILVYASLQCLYHMTAAVQAVESTHCGY